MSQISPESPHPESAEQRPDGAPAAGWSFGTGTLLFVFTLLILVAAACGGLVRMGSVGAQDAKMLIFALPLGGMIVASLLRALFKWVNRRPD